jgi:hypothetical protein
LFSDMSRPTILRHAARTLDFGQPVDILLLGILHFLLDEDDPRAIVNRLVDAVPSGSHLALTHATKELGGTANAEAQRSWNEKATVPLTAGNRAQITGFFEQLELLEPGVGATRPLAAGAPPTAIRSKWQAIAPSGASRRRHSNSGNVVAVRREITGRSACRWDVVVSVDCWHGILDYDDPCHHGHS